MRRYLHFQLVNRGANILVVPSSSVVVQDPFRLKPATPGGSISGSILGNDRIVCGNVRTTFYIVMPMKDWVHPLRDGEAFVICSSGSTLATCSNRSRHVHPGNSNTASLNIP